MQVTNFVGGFIIGLGLIVPGVSGAVLAMVLGLYEPIILALAKPFHNLKQNLTLLIPVALGAGVCLLLFTRLLEFLFGQYPLPTLYLFFGLVLGSVPTLIRSAQRKGFRLSFLPCLCLGFGLLLFTTNLPILLEDPHTFALGQFVLLGAITGIGLIIPGLSASFLLMAFGFYEHLLKAINQVNFSVLIPMALGLVPTIILMSKGITWLFAKAHGYFSYVILGLLLGSLVVAFPGWPRTWLELVISSLLFIFGVVVSRSFTTNSRDA